MRFVIQLFLAVIIGIAAVFAVANRKGTKIDFSPLPFTAELPLYIVILSAISIGLIVGVSLSSLLRFRLRLRSRKYRKRAEALEMVVGEKIDSSSTPNSSKLQRGKRLALNED